MSRTPRSRLDIHDTGAAGKRLLEAWTHPAGTAVFVTGDDGIERPAITRSEARAMGNGYPLVAVTGHAGGYSLSRVRLASSTRRVHLASPSDRHDADPGCGATMTRRDTLTADLDQVTCVQCKEALGKLRTAMAGKSTEQGAVEESTKQASEGLHVVGVSCNVQSMSTRDFALSVLRGDVAGDRRRRSSPLAQAASLLFLSLSADPSGIITASNDQIAKGIQLSPGAVEVAVKVLTEIGAVKVLRRGYAGTGPTYQVVAAPLST